MVLFRQRTLARIQFLEKTLQVICGGSWGSIVFDMYKVTRSPPGGGWHSASDTFSCLAGALVCMRYINIYSNRLQTFAIDSELNRHKNPPMPSLALLVTIRMWAC